VTAQEIRAKWEQTRNSVINGEEWSAWALIEIAAQLAELNYNLSPAGKAEAEKLTAQIKGHF